MDKDIIDKDIITETIMEIIMEVITQEDHPPEEHHPDMGLLGIMMGLGHHYRADMWSLKEFYRA